MGPTALRHTAIALAALWLFPATTAHAAANPVPSVRIVAAEIYGATVAADHLNVAVTANCDPGRDDTEGLIVTTVSPRATTDDLLECTNNSITQVVAVTSSKGMYKSGTPVTITATMRTTAKKVLATQTKTVAVQ
jgi:hypothetical protein